MAVGAVMPVTASRTPHTSYIPTYATLLWVEYYANKFGAIL